MQADVELLSEFTRTRSEQAFRRLVERYGGTVHSICYRRLRDPHLAEDAAQMVFATLARKADSISPEVVGPWLFQTAHFVAQGVARKRERHKKRELRSAAERRQSYQAPDAAEMVEMVDRHLMKLDESSRNALVLRYIEEKSVPEVAKALEISPEAAKKRLARGLSRLREMLAEGGVVASVVMLKDALSGVGRGVLPPGFVDRVVEKLGGEGGLAKGKPARTPKWVITIGATTVASVVGATTVWWVNAGGGAAPQTLPVPQPAPRTAEQRLMAEIPHFGGATNLNAVLAMFTSRTGEKFDVQWERLKEKGIRPDTQVSEDFINSTLGNALEQLLKDLSSKPGELRYIVQPDRIVITAGGSDVSPDKQKN